MPDQKLIKVNNGSRVQGSKNNSIRINKKTMHAPPFRCWLGRVGRERPVACDLPHCNHTDSLSSLSSLNPLTQTQSPVTQAIGECQFKFPLCRVCLCGNLFGTSTLWGLAFWRWYLQGFSGVVTSIIIDSKEGCIALLSFSFGSALLEDGPACRWISTGLYHMYIIQRFRAHSTFGHILGWSGRVKKFKTMASEHSGCQCPHDYVCTVPSPTNHSCASS